MCSRIIDVEKQIYFLSISEFALTTAEQNQSISTVYWEQVPSTFTPLFLYFIQFVAELN